MGEALLFCLNILELKYALRSEKSSEKIHSFAFVYNIGFEMKRHIILYASYCPRHNFTGVSYHNRGTRLLLSLFSFLYQECVA